MRDRGARYPVRTRRQWQKEAEGLGFTFSAPLSYTEASSTVSILTGNGLTLSGSTLIVNLASNAGLAFSGTAITTVVDTSFGLSLNSSGIRVDLASNSGLEFSSGDLRIAPTFITFASTNQLGFFGNAAISRPAGYTITAAPAVATALNASGNAGVAYTGIDNLQVGTVYATVADLNALRTEMISAAGVLRQLIKHLGDTSGLGLIDETGY